MHTSRHDRVGSSNLIIAFNAAGRGFPFPTCRGRRVDVVVGASLNASHSGRALMQGCHHGGSVGLTQHAPSDAPMRPFYGWGVTRFRLWWVSGMSIERCHRSVVR